MGVQDASPWELQKLGRTEQNEIPGFAQIEIYLSGRTESNPEGCQTHRPQQDEQDEYYNLSCQMPC